MSYDLPLWQKLVGKGLTKKQAEVAMYACHGHSNKDIELKLCINRRTVKYHLEETYSKLYLKSRYELMIYAAREMLK